MNDFQCACGFRWTSPFTEQECPSCNGIARDEAIRLAYGLLWHMAIDRSDDNLRLASDARHVLEPLLSTDEKADGIARAKATDARFTGAA